MLGLEFLNYTGEGLLRFSSLPGWTGTVKEACNYFFENLSFLHWTAKSTYILRSPFFISPVFGPLFIFLIMPVLLVFCAHYEKKQPYYSFSVFSGWFSVYVLIISFFLTHEVLFLDHLFLNGAVLVNQFSLLFNSTIIVFSIASTLIAIPYVFWTRTNSYEFFCLFLISCAGMLWLVFSQNLLMIYLCIELQALAFYILSSYKRNSLHSVEAGLKYFSLSAMGSGMLLFGFTLIYYVTGSIHLQEIGTLVECLMSVSDFDKVSTYVYPLVLGVLMIMSAFLFKLPAAPFHMWAADVYEGSPTSSTAYFMVVPKLALFSVLSSLLIKIFYPLFSFWQPAVLIISVLSLIVGYLSTLNQINLKRLFVYSGVSHVGFMLLALGSIGSEMVPGGFFDNIFEFPGFSLFFYIISYSIMIFSGMVFIMLNSGYLNLSTNRFAHYGVKNYPMPYLNLSRSFLTLALFFSFMGIPPTLGFFSKFFILKESAVWASSFVVFLALFFIITSSGFVYGRLIAYMFFKNISLDLPRYWWSSFQNSSIWAYSFSASVLLSMLFFLYPTPLFYLADSMSGHFCLDAKSWFVTCTFPNNPNCILFQSSDVLYNYEGLEFLRTAK